MQPNKQQNDKICCLYEKSVQNFFFVRFALENTSAPKTSNFLNNACQSRIEYIFLR